jgi:hypothetical protein
MRANAKINRKLITLTADERAPARHFNAPFKSTDDSSYRRFGTYCK